MGIPCTAFVIFLQAGNYIKTKFKKIKVNIKTVTIYN